MVNLILALHLRTATNKSKAILLIYITQRNKMSKKLVFIRNWQGKVVSASSFAQDRSDEIQQPSFVLYECLRSIIRKQCRYPFQLLKSFILFSDQQSSIEVGYKHMRHELQLIQVNLKAFCSLMRQKMLVAGFITIKHVYQKRLRIEAAYGSIENIQCLKQSIVVIESLQKLRLKWQVFGKLYQNFKGFKLSKINLSKIDVINNDFTSKQLMQFEPFLNDKIDVINSFIIDKTIEQHQEQQEQDLQEVVQVQKLNIQKKSQIKQYAFKQNRLVSERSVGKVTPATERQSKQKQTDQLQSKMFVTHRKQTDLLQNMSSNKYRRDMPTQKQYIYLIRDYRKRLGTPTNYIKIPLNTQNVEIVEVNTEKKKKSKKVDIEERICLAQNSCQNCKFCQQFNERREIMKTVTQRLEIIKTQNISSVTEFRTDFLGERNQSENTLKSISQQQAAFSSYSSVREEFFSK